MAHVVPIARSDQRACLIGGGITFLAGSALLIRDVIH
ncbi:myosin-crossreactive antigen [Methylobacterium persicinum]|uniref:Myosin-crossreactive antigen n=1 Tax=Methylobacterium persicinum TaxID=374426 RepID=A0ABU0HSR7_9HYPH|nr:myosin-crossreactive antigen [Methylobacterium persicinum]GJE40273.1 hypothetical protein KHHGKMAE_4364 [Methylobacterium persicinum]